MRHGWVTRSSTSEVDLSLLASLHPDGLVVGLVTLHLEAGRYLVAHEALLTLQHQHRPAPQPQQHGPVSTRRYLHNIYSKHKDNQECDGNVVIVN